MDEITAFLDEDESQFELPRLRIIHLMIWMAATALAFVPYQLLQRYNARSNTASGGTVASPSTFETAVWTVSGLSLGTHLFVTAAVLVWKGRGYRGRLEPGHHLAFQGATAWLIFVGIWAVIAMAGNDAYGRFGYWLSLPQVFLQTVWFFWFLTLAIRGGHAGAWRFAFASIAIAPLAGWVLRVVGEFLPWTSSSMRGLALFALAQIASYGLQCIGLGAPLPGDLRRSPARHWSHWASVGAKWVMLGTGIAYYTWLMMNPPN